MDEQNKLDINKKEFCERWLSDGIGKDYEEWTCKNTTENIIFSDIVFIESPTGTGKTTFILKELFPYAIKNGRNILYLSNRTALKEQLSKSAEDKYEVKIEEITSGVRKSEVINVRMKESSNKLTILNYQSILSFLKRGEGFFGKDIDYVILDEAHFFLEDALFNPMTYRILKKISTVFPSSVIIFMSATLSESEKIADAFLHNTRITTINYFLKDKYKNCVKGYYNTFKRTDYNVIMYQRKEDLLTKIKLSDKSEKWLIFVSSKEDGKNLKKDIQRYNRSVAFITSESKNTGTWKEIVDKSRFKENILISTSVLDNGVNIKDPAVKHIVLPFCYRIEFLQMLGRRRVEQNEIINVYTKVLTIQTINSHLRKLKKMLWKIEKVEKLYTKVKQIKDAGREYKKGVKEGICLPGFENIFQYNCNIEEKKMTALIQEMWGTCDKSINGLFFLNNERDLVPNPLAKIKIQILIDFYNSIIDKKSICVNSRYTIYAWLGMGDTAPKYINSKDVYSLIEYLEIFLDKEIQTVNELEDFYQGFISLYQEYSYAQFVTDPQKLDKALHIRKEKARRKATINTALEMVELPYELIKKNKKWYLKSKE